MIRVDNATNCYPVWIKTLGHQGDKNHRLEKKIIRHIVFLKY